jgi:hypothetical protein
MIQVDLSLTYTFFDLPGILFFLLAPVFDTRAEVGEDSLFPPVSLPDPTQHKLKQSNKFIFVHFSKIPKNLPLDIL